MARLWYKQKGTQIELKTMYLCPTGTPIICVLNNESWRLIMHHYRERISVWQVVTSAGAASEQVKVFDGRCWWASHLASTSQSVEAGHMVVPMP